MGSNPDNGPRSADSADAGRERACHAAIDANDASHRAGTTGGSCTQQSNVDIRTECRRRTGREFTRTVAAILDRPGTFGSTRTRDDANASASTGHKPADEHRCGNERCGTRVQGGSRGDNVQATRISILAEPQHRHRSHVKRDACSCSAECRTCDCSAECRACGCRSAECRACGCSAECRACADDSADVSRASGECRRTSSEIERVADGDDTERSAADH